MSDDDSLPDDHVIYDRETIEGRGNGDGRWLEYQLYRALDRWGYSSEMRQTVGKTEQAIRLACRRV